MSKTVLANVNGFYPVIENIINDLGAIPALVFGVVWRYCQMETGSCTASLDTLSSILGMSRVTVSKHLGSLVKAGYLTANKTPGNVVIYSDTGKAEIKITLAAGYKESIRGGIKKLDTPYKETLQGGVKKLYTIKDINKDTNPLATQEDSIAQDPPPSPKENKVFTMALVLSEVTGIPFEPNKGRLLKEAALVLKYPGITPDQIRKDYGVGGSWYKTDWRAKGGKPPSLYAIRETLGNLGKKNGRPTAQVPDRGTIKEIYEEITKDG